MNTRGAPKGASQAGAAKPQTRNNSTPAVRPGVYTRPLPLHARHLPPECWWLRDQWWCEIHLARLAQAWERVYGRAA